MRALAGATMLLALVAGSWGCDDDEAPPAAPATPEPAPEPLPPPPPGPAVDLLHGVPAAVAVSSEASEATSGRLLVDTDLRTAWCSRPDERTDAFIEVRVPEVAHVERIEITPGFTERAREDLFTAHPRIRRLRIRRGSEVVTEQALDPQRAELQAVPVDRPGGELRIEIVDLLPGLRPDLSEVCVSELRVMGRAPAAGSGLQPTVTVGALRPAGAGPAGAAFERLEPGEPHAIESLPEPPPADEGRVADYEGPGDAIGALLEASEGGERRRSHGGTGHAEDLPAALIDQGLVELERPVWWRPAPDMTLLVVPFGVESDVGVLFAYAVYLRTPEGMRRLHVFQQSPEPCDDTAGPIFANAWLTRDGSVLHQVKAACTRSAEHVSLRYQDGALVLERETLELPD